MVRYEEFIRKLMDDFTDDSVIDPKDFPNMNLYADQVAGFISEKMPAYDGEEGEPILTKTMISNYVKHDMIPSPEKKKYSRDHMIMLVAILYLKSTFQISDIEKLMAPFVENYNSTFEDKIDFYEIYSSVASHFKAEREETTEDILNNIDGIKEAIRDRGINDDDTTEIFLVMLSLAMKVDAAKYAANSLLKEYFSKPTKSEKKAAKEKKVKDKKVKEKKVKENKGKEQKPKAKKSME